MDRARIEQALAARTAPLPAELVAGFEAFCRGRHLRFLVVVNVAAQAAYFSYALADALIVPDIATLSLMVRSLFLLLTLPFALLMLRRCASMQVLDMLLPGLITVATVLWFELLSHSRASAVGSYAYASVIFIMLANLCVRVRFRPALLNSLLIAGITLTGVARLSGGLATQAVLIFALVYLPVLLFSLFISWWAAFYGRRAYLRELLDADTREELLRANRRLQAEAATDSLTGIANRRQFDAQAERTWDHARREGRVLCLMMLDIDHFKPYNDHYGHPAGDAALVRVAQELTRQLDPGPHTLVGRYGGEEFAVLLTLRPSDTMLCRTLARQLVHAVWQLGIDHQHRPDDECRVTLSVGAALSNESEIATLADLMRCADSRLYAAKRAGRNRVVVAG